MLKKKTWQPIANLLLIIAVGWGGFQVLEIGKNKSDKRQLLTNYCQLSTQACEQNNVSVTLSTDVIHPMKATQVNVSWPELPEKTNSLMLTLEGHEMMMGIYQLKLSRASNGQFSGDLLLPFCTSNEMTWLGDIKPLSEPEQITPISISLRMTK